jgi:hypothetical protein
LLRKAWTVVGADWNNPRGSLVIAFMLVATGAVIIVFLSMGITSANKDTTITSLVLYSLYELWLLVAFYYNAYYVYLGEDMVVLTQLQYIRAKKSRYGIPLINK